MNPSTAEPEGQHTWIDRMPLSVAATVEFVGSLGFATCLWMVFGSMTDVVVNNGGMCASGGPYEISLEHQCSTGSSILIAIGGPGILVFGAIALAGVWRVLGPRGGGHLLLLGTLVFGLLGWNFLRLGFGDTSTDPALVGCGVLFLLMAVGGLGGLVPVLGLQTPAFITKRTISTQPPLVVASRQRQQIYWVTFIAGTAAGVFLGMTITNSLL